MAYKDLQEPFSAATDLLYARFHPLKASLRILHPDDPSVEPSNFDVVTTTGCLRRIARFLERSENRTERLDIEFYRESGTLFLSRWSEDPWKRTHLGFGMQFERLTRSFDYAGRSQDEGVKRLRDSMSHHRIIRFEMGGLRFLVQTESDAVYCGCHNEKQLLSLAADVSARLRTSLEPDEKKASKIKRASKRRTKRLDTTPPPKPRATQTLSGRFDALSLDDPGDMIAATPSPPRKAKPKEDTADQSVILAGALLPNSCTLEIKTRAKQAPFRNDMRPQLYFQRTGRVFEALHENNRFRWQDMSVRAVPAEMRAWEEERQEMLGRLVGLLGEVRRRASESNETGGEKQEGESVKKMGLILKVGEEMKGKQKKEGDGWKAVLYMGHV